MRGWIAAGLVAAGLAVAEPARAEGWADEDARARIATTGTLVVHLYVPLCHNGQIDCGSTSAGDPDDLDRNLYWGAIFGHRRMLARPGSGYEHVWSGGAVGGRLERAVFRRWIDGGAWGRKEKVELLIVADAWHGDAIDEAVDRFFDESEAGARIRFGDGDAARTVRVDVVGYAGHDRLMDGTEPPRVSSPGRARPIPSFVLACYSAAYFGAALEARGSKSLVTTQALMAPEGYLTEAVALGLARNEPSNDIRTRAVAAYATWQRITTGVAETIFSRP